MTELKWANTDGTLDDLIDRRGFLLLPSFICWPNFLVGVVKAVQRRRRGGCVYNQIIAPSTGPISLRS